jgi:2-dehydro-3-deoxyphosphogluconate aldolase/(4S)-4-hydroxy-2-oxoglutarate aldolase
MQLSDPTPLIAMPVIPVVTIERVADAVPLARALLAGGLKVVEITLRTPAALEAVRAILAEVKEIIVGVGTVVKPLDVTHALDAGADFLVSPAHRRISRRRWQTRRCRRCPAAPPYRRR